MANNTEYKIDWIIPKLRKPCRFCWTLASSLTVAAVGIFSKLFLEFLNRTRVHNRHIITQALDKRPPCVPLITVSNHHSCFDDPGLWGQHVDTHLFSDKYNRNIWECIVESERWSIEKDGFIVSLNWRHLISRNTMRWALAAHDICFTNVFHSYFFMLGKCVPVVRGKGVYQEVMDFCIERLAKGEWVHVFPEGRVNMAKEFIRLKWGVGRLVYESPVVPMVIPMWHEGMEKVLPNEPPYYLRAGQKVTLNFGEPLDLTNLVKDLRAQNVSEMEARKAITDKIQEALMKLKSVTEKLHEAP